MDLPAELRGMGLPVANEENKKLEAEVNRKEVEINALQSQIEDHGERIQALREHRKNVMQELNQTQGLYEARRRDHQTEDHMKQIAERENGRLRMELKRAQSELDNIKEQMNIYENNIYRTIHEMEGLKNRMKWDQQTLDAYLEESAQKDEDVLVLQKYARQDEGKIKELTLRMQSLQDNLSRNRRALDNERTETLSAQIELDKTAEEFRRAHQERHDLIHQWESTIGQMKKRDSDIDKAATDLATTRSEIRDKSEAVKEKHEFLDQEKQNNEEVTKKVSIAERQSAKMRLDYQDAETGRLQFKDELETLKYSVDRTATDLEGMRAQCAVLSRQVREQTQRLETYQVQRHTLVSELQKKMQSSLTAEERAHEMDEVLSIEEANIKKLEREVEKSREKQFKKNQELFECKQNEVVLVAELQGGRVAARNLSSKQHKLDEETLKQQEILYTQDFQLQQQEGKVARLMGERSDEEQSALNDKIKELEAKNATQQQEEHLLKAQLKSLQDDLRRVGRRLEMSSKDKAQLTGRIDELHLHIDSTQRELKKLVAQKQDLMVDENIHKLEVRRLRETLFAHADDVLSLEKRKLHLHTAMSERTKEIDMHKEMVQAETKTAEAERQTASSELHERISKIDKLRKRYEILEVSMAPPEGEEEHSQAYYVIKAAQEREELQRKGDDLDAKIQKAEREIKALGNTLTLMNSRNETFRKSLTRVETKGEEVVELEHLEGQMRTLMDKFKHQRRELKQTKDDTKSMTETLTALDSRKDLFATLVGERKKTVSDLQKEISEQRQKQDRVMRQTNKLQKEIRAKKGALEATAEEHDISLREMRDLNLAVAQQLAQVTVQHSDLTETMKQMFAEANLPPPTTPTSSRLGSRPASSQSSSRSALSHRSSISTRGGPTPIQPKAVEIGMGSAGSTPRDSLSSRGSASSVGSKKPISSRASSKASSRQSSRAPSIASSRTGSKQTLDLSIGPA